MDTTKILADLKKRPGFAENVGMVLVHNGVVRGWSRADHAPVISMRVHHDAERLNAICRDWKDDPVFSAFWLKRWTVNSGRATTCCFSS